MAAVKEPVIVSVGSLGEDNEWHILTDYQGEAWLDDDGEVTGNRPCPHAVEVREEMHHPKNQGGNNWKVRRWNVPVAIMVRTQGGHDATILCALCVSDALKAVIP
jgi:hypothetical protein